MVGSHPLPGFPKEIHSKWFTRDFVPETAFRRVSLAGGVGRKFGAAWKSFAEVVMSASV
jgi:hypothetical protein